MEGDVFFNVQRYKKAAFTLFQKFKEGNELIMTTITNSHFCFCNDGNIRYKGHRYLTGSKLMFLLWG